MENLPAELVSVVRAFIDGLRSLLGDGLAGTYLYGALAFPDSRDQAQDIDFHVVVRQPLANAQRQDVHRLIRGLARDFGHWADEMDGYFILRDDMRWTAPPRHQMWPLSRVPVDAAWALHCAHIHAGRFLAPYGPDPRDLYPTPSWPDLSAALFSEVRFVDQHIAGAPAYGVLNAVRILYSFTTRDVVISKHGAAIWSLPVVPKQWHRLIEAALRSYRGEASAEDQEILQSQSSSFVQFIWQEIAVLPVAQ